MYAVIHTDSRTEISRHDTPAQALAAIRTYEALDRNVDGVLHEYDWIPVEDEDEYE